MKKTACILLVVVLMLCAMPTVFAASPTVITTAEELNGIRDNLSGSYVLGADIIFSPEDFLPGGAFYNNGYGWLPIGYDTGHTFKGTFDGAGHTISGLTIHKAYYQYSGLFGVNGGEIKNLKVVDVNINTVIGINKEGSSSGADGGNVDYNDPNVWTNPDGSGGVMYDYTGKSTSRTGAVCGYNSKTVENCYASGYIEANAVAGGIAGRNSNTINGCYSAATVISNDFAGGITAVSRSSYANITNCLSTAVVQSRCTDPFGLAGGIVGDVNDSKNLNNCLSYSITAATYRSSVVVTNSKAKLSALYYYDNAYSSDLFGTAAPLGDTDSVSLNSSKWTNGDGMPYLTYFGKPDLSVIPVIGDYNGDRKINTLDLALVKLSLANSAKVELLGLSDYNLDGVLDSTDLSEIKNRLANFGANKQ